MSAPPSPGKRSAPSPRSANLQGGELGLRDEFRGFKHHPFYPGGGILYFDVARYLRNAIADRLLANFNEYRERLVYAEQDLLCLTLKDDELTALADAGLRCHIDLASPDWQTATEHARIHASPDCFYIKHVGSFKPWKNGCCTRPRRFS